MYAAAFQNKSCTFYLTLLPPGVTAAAGHGSGETPPALRPPKPLFFLQPIPAASGRRLPSERGERNETRGKARTGGAELPFLAPGRSGECVGAPPERTPPGFSPAGGSRWGGWSRGGVFAPFPAETSPNSGCFEAPTCGSRGGFYFQARTMLPRTKFVGGGRGERSPPRPGSPANDRGDGLCPSPPAPPSPGGSLQAASVTSPALTGLRLETAEKGIFSLASRLILEFLLPQPLASKPRPARTSAPRQRGEQPPGLSPLSREGGCVEKKR